VCGPNPEITELIDYEVFCGTAPAPADGAAASTAAESDITPLELKAKLDRGERFELVDVREEYELDISKLPYTTWIPIGEFPNRIGELDPSSETIVYCRSGSRSGKAVELLRSSGFKKARNLSGGILRWADDVDRSMDKY
jgi:adenylyltransferase/sulfurtransferase